MSAHVTAIVKVRFAALRQIRSVHRSLTRTTLLTLVYVLVVAKVDNTAGWLRSTVMLAERRSLAGEQLTLSCARPVADG